MDHSILRFVRSRAQVAALVCLLAAQADFASAQLEITEVMHTPLGNQNLWEWVEVRNTSSTAIDLDGWIFDDEVLA